MPFAAIREDGGLNFVTRTEPEVAPVKREGEQVVRTGAYGGRNAVTATRPGKGVANHGGEESPNR